VQKNQNTNSKNALKKKAGNCGQSRQTIRSARGRGKGKLEAEERRETELSLGEKKTEGKKKKDLSLQAIPQFTKN